MNLGSGLLWGAGAGPGAQRQRGSWGGASVGAAKRGGRGRDRTAGLGTGGHRGNTKRVQAVTDFCGLRTPFRDTIFPGPTPSGVQRGETAPQTRLVQHPPDLPWGHLLPRCDKVPTAKATHLHSKHRAISPPTAATQDEVWLSNLRGTGTPHPSTAWPWAWCEIQIPGIWSCRDFGATPCGPRGTCPQGDTAHSTGWFRPQQG